MGNEEGRDRDRDRVIEHLAPSSKEGPELVEGAAREARRTTSLWVHRGRLGVAAGREEEDEASDDENNWRQAERERGNEAKCVIDRRTDVAVGG